MATVQELLDRSGSSASRLRLGERRGSTPSCRWAYGRARSDRIIAYPEAPVGEAAAAAYEADLARREKGEPIAYIRGLKEFHGLAFATTPAP